MVISKFPKKILYGQTLNLFHEQHIGVLRAKMWMYAYCSWPYINKDFEKFIALCEVLEDPSFAVLVHRH